jgi:hypothetical protein
MSDAPLRPRWLWPWLHAAGLGLAVLYVVLWKVELYLFIFAFLAGASLFFGTYIGLVAFRLIKHRQPWIDRAAVVLLAAMIIVHVVLLAALRTINWC